MPARIKPRDPHIIASTEKNRDRQVGQERHDGRSQEHLRMLQTILNGNELLVLAKLVEQASLGGTY